MATHRTSSRKHVVIVGGGFAGLSAARHLVHHGLEITLLDRNNYHLFQPLLYQVATGTLAPHTVAQPIRSLFRRDAEVKTLMATVERIDLDAREVIASEVRLSYDYLILATGARHSYFGNEGWSKVAPGLKDIPDAIEIRSRIYGAFEAAEHLPADSPERRKALTFAIVGAGPTGVELAGAIAEIARHTLPRDFRQMDPTETRIVLIDAADRVFPAFAPELSDLAEKQIRRLGIELILDASVEEVSEGTVRCGDHTIEARTILWAAGNQASAIGKESGMETDRAGRVKVRSDLTLPDHPEVLVLGDCAHFEHDGKPLPALASVALQQGRQAARNVRAMIDGREPEPFHYKDRGVMATIGRHAGVADLKFVKFGGALAWHAWLFVHLFFLIGLRNRIVALAQWFWAYLTFSRHVRLITWDSKRVM